MATDLNEKAEQAVLAAVADAGVVPAGPTRAALIRRGLVYPMNDKNGLAGRLTFEGEKVAYELQARNGNPGPATEGPVVEPEPRAVSGEKEIPQVPAAKPGELHYAAMITPGQWYCFPGLETLSDSEVVPAAELVALREVLAETLGAVEDELDKRGFFRAPKRYLPVSAEGAEGKA